MSRYRSTHVKRLVRFKSTVTIFPSHTELYQKDRIDALECQAAASSSSLLGRPRCLVVVFTRPTPLPRRRLYSADPAASSSSLLGRPRCADGSVLAGPAGRRPILGALSPRQVISLHDSRIIIKNWEAHVFPFYCPMNIN